MPVQQTSIDAYEESLGNLPERSERVIDLFRDFGPLTDEELREAYHSHYGFIEKNSLEPVRCHLRDAGIVVATPARRPSKYGRNRIVWALAQRRNDGH